MLQNDSAWKPIRVRQHRKVTVILKHFFWVKFMNKHTPGPWNNLPRMSCVPVCGQHEAGLSIGFINSSNPDRIAEGKANAHLIVAAPDLLEALELVVSEGLVSKDGTIGKVIFSAIAKAKGEAK